MANEAIGRVGCPLCGRPATVHQNKRADRLRYIRCGVVVRGFSTGCGTLQPYGESGQRWIADRLQPLDSDPKGCDPAPEPAPAAAEPAPAPERVQPEPKHQPQPESAPAPRRGLWARVIEGATGEL